MTVGGRRAAVAGWKDDVCFSAWCANGSIIAIGPSVDLAKSLLVDIAHFASCRTARLSNSSIPMSRLETVTRGAITSSLTQTKDGRDRSGDGCID
jgi:hypothetical protein